MKLETVSAEIMNAYHQLSPQLLIDGNYDTYTHTEAGSTGIWIAVKLAQPERISKIRIVTGEDFEGCLGMIVGLSVYIKLDENIVKECGTIDEDKIYYTIGCEEIGNIVELSKEGNVDCQNIIEIEVFGTRTAGNITSIFKF